jgi:hypothetical protein
MIETLLAFLEETSKARHSASYKSEYVSRFTIPTHAVTKVLSDLRAFKWGLTIQQYDACSRRLCKQTIMM